MADREDWLFRPAVKGMCRLESLFDGTLSLDQIAMANDALDVMAENEHRLQEALKD
jgi:hypothetical protein